MVVDSPGHEWLTRVIYPGEIDSEQYDTPGRLTCRGMQPRGNWFAEVCNPREILWTIIFHDSPGYHTLGYHSPGSHVLAEFLLTRLGMIPWKVMLLYSVIRKNLIVLFTVSVESNEIETSIFKKCKTYIKLKFFPKNCHFYFYTFWVLTCLRVSKN